jgi:hypothetical protein
MSIISTYTAQIIMNSHEWTTHLCCLWVTDWHSTDKTEVDGHSVDSESSGQGLVLRRNTCALCIWYINTKNRNRRHSVKSHLVNWSQDYVFSPYLRETESIVNCCNQAKWMKKQINLDAKKRHRFWLLHSTEVVWFRSPKFPHLQWILSFCFCF